MTDPRALLDAYAAETVEVESEWGVIEPITRADAAEAALAALRALLDKHQPFQYGDEEMEFDDASRRWCRECTGGDEWRRAQWPCVTVRTITGALTCGDTP